MKSHKPSASRFREILTTTIVLFLGAFLFSRVDLRGNPKVTTFSEQKIQEKGLDYNYLYSCNGECGPLQRCFLGKCFCLPGRGGLNCEEHRLPEHLISGQHCPIFNSLDELNFKRVDQYPVEHCRITYEPNSFNCGIYCYWQEDSGITQVGEKTWERVSDTEFKIWDEMQGGSSEDRNSEHAEGFNQFVALPSKLGNYLEVGAGPYTQTNNILTLRNDVEMKSIYLAEPNIFRYLTLNNCLYKDGKIKGHRVNLLSLPVEELPSAEFFDTVLSVNVIEHVYNAFDFLTAIYKSLKPGGILVLGERYFEDPDRDGLALGPARIHPIRVKQQFLQHFLRLFDIIYLADHNTKASKMRCPECDESGYYFIGRKKKHFSIHDEPSSMELEQKYPTQPFETILG